MNWKVILYTSMVWATVGCSNGENNADAIEGLIEELTKNENGEEDMARNDDLKNPSGKVIAFYNVENLFDIYDDPEKHDEWFLPTSETRWNEEKYERKLDRISEVISEIHKDHPILVGMVEIENKQVLRDLVAEDEIEKSEYSIITENSPDERGIDVALLYNPSFFKYKDHEAITIDLPREPDGSIDYTRDILYVKGELQNDELHVFVNHWPSRREAIEIAEPKRMFVAQVLRNRINDILENDPMAKILVMGDFNDYPDSRSIRETLRAKGTKGITDGELYNLAAILDNDDQGSHFYKGDWGMLDQMMISKGFLNPETGIGIKGNALKIFKEKFILFKHPKYKTWQPNRTYSGPKYHGGYSDHLPIYIKLK